MGEGARGWGLFEGARRGVRRGMRAGDRIFRRKSGMGLCFDEVLPYLLFVKKTSSIPKTKNIVIGQKISTIKKRLSRDLRKRMTPAEKILWNQLRNNKLGGFHFRRQQIIDGIIADFYCHNSSLVVEVDGTAHNHRKEYDEARDNLLGERKLKVIRFNNNQVMDNLDMVLSIILDSCKSPRT